MGRNAKRKQERNARRIVLTGEQAEVFDVQMDSDRDWLEGSDEFVRFAHTAFAALTSQGGRS